jgi:membrane protease YdiL (CAAX protease family)
MVAVMYMAIMFTLIYRWRGSLVAPIVMHFLQDFLGIVIVPWLQH